MKQQIEEHYKGKYQERVERNVSNRMNIQESIGVSQISFKQQRMIVEHQHIELLSFSAQ